MADIQDDPVQLVSCVDGKLSLHTDRLRASLSSEVNDLPLLVVSIIGDTGTGKSFLINLMASYLRHQEDRVDRDWKLSDEVVRGMHYEPADCEGSKRTLGMYMWHRPFRINTASGEVAILLIDCQGSGGIKDGNDNVDSAIHYLSLQLADVQIMNIQGILKHTQLESIRSTAQSLEERGCDQMPEKLVFTLRDMSRKAGGFGEKPDAYRNAVEACDDAHKEAFSHISITFREVTTFAFPHPSIRVADAAQDDDDTIQVKDIPNDFLWATEMLVQSIRNTKTINTAISTIDCFEALKEPFESGELFDGLKTVSNMRRDLRAYKAFSEAEVKIAEVESRLTQSMDDSWTEQRLDENHRHDSDIILRDFDAHNVRSIDHNSTTLHNRIQQSLESMRSILRQKKAERDNQRLKRENKGLQIGLCIGGAVVGVGVALGLTAFAIVCPPAFLAGIPLLAEGLAAGGAALAAGAAGGSAVGAVLISKDPGVPDAVAQIKLDGESYNVYNFSNCNVFPQSACQEISNNSGPGSQITYVVPSNKTVTDFEWSQN